MSLPDRRRPIRLLRDPLLIPQRRNPVQSHSCSLSHLTSCQCKSLSSDLMASPVVKMLSVTGRVQIESPYPGRDTFKNHSQCLAASKNTNERVPSSSEELAKLIQVPPVMRTRYLNRDIPIPSCRIPLTHHIRRLLARKNDKRTLSLTEATHDDNPPDSVVVGFSRSSSRTVH